MEVGEAILAVAAGERPASFEQFGVMTSRRRLRIAYRPLWFHPRPPASAGNQSPERTPVHSASAPTLSRLNAGPTEPRGDRHGRGGGSWGPATFLAAQDPCPLGWTPCPWRGRAPSFRFNVAGRWAPAMSERDLLEVQPTHAPHVHPPLQGVRSPDCGGRADRGRGRGDRRRARRGVLRTLPHPAPPGSLVALRGRSGGLTGRSTREDGATAPSSTSGRRSTRATCPSRVPTSPA